MSLDLQFLKELGLSAENPAVCTGTEWFGTQQKGSFASYSPVDGKLIGKVYKADKADYERLVLLAQKAFIPWRRMPAPRRGEIVRQIGDKLREKKTALGKLVAYEMGKSLQEGLGEVQEMIDICDFSVGLSRQLHGLTMHSERPNHRMYEQWHPVGLVGIISAFNFPVAVWSWNSMIAAVCGNVSIWKPSEKTPLSAIACFHIIREVLLVNGVPEGVLNLIVGDVNEIGETMLADARIPLISATGSTRMGKRVGSVVGARLGRSILELGGNNAIILSPATDLKLAAPAVVFGAVGTCGQRCTSTRRLIVHDSIYEQVKQVLLKAYNGLRIGSPLNENNHVGPLIDKQAVESMQEALKQAQKQGAKLLHGGQVLDGEAYASGCYVQPAIVEATNDLPIVQEETFAPILYLLRYKGDVEEAINLQNNVKQGLSSSIFTLDLREAETFLSAWGSDCGIANVNIGTSGAEIGGAFGGEKETGGGRESGSDAWKAYMRRQTNTINYGKQLPLAQGIKFDI
ncbi:MAG: aldehyde dehydrogenase family protein [Proteobacteria bacterium]|nr:aldehyde dehydrogenase family protein [Pseudomonadota bacterium]